MAKMSSFTYLKYAVPQQKRGVGVIGELRFNIRSESAEDGGDDFDEAKEAMKRAIPARLRSWDNEKKLWHVFVTEQVRAALPAIFGNAEKLFLEVEQQLCLPGLEL